MRKLLLPVLALCLILFACKKSESILNPKVSGEKTPVNFSLKDFLQKVEDLPAPNARIVNATAQKNNGLITQISHIYYFLFEGNNLINAIHQKVEVDPENFGIITELLDPNTYTIVMVASKDSLHIWGEGSLFSTIEYDLRYPIKPTGDLFYKKFTVTVAEPNPAINTSVTLDRIVGKLEVNIWDAPILDSDISVEIGPEQFSFYVQTGIATFSELEYASMKPPRFDRTTFSSLVANTAVPFKVFIKYRHKVTGVEETKVIENVRCYRNKKTTISGYLYGAPEHPGSELTIGLNDTWETTGPVISF
jgi:hypothetical protein